MNESLEVRKYQLGLPSFNGKDTLHCVIWEPQGDIYAKLLICHGMVEYIDRYEDFARYLASFGILVAGYDQLGHGKTAKNEEALGHLNCESGSAVLVRDLHRVSIALNRRYPEIPFFLLGHSMGSFITRRYISEYGNNMLMPSPTCPSSNLAGYICMGTGTQPSAALLAAKTIANSQEKRHGAHYRSELLKKLSFSGYLKGIPKYKVIQDEEDNYYLKDRNDNDWLTHDEDIVEKYSRSKYCTFTFTVEAYKELFDTISYIQKKNNLEKIPKGLPVLFISGEKDPVGKNGKAVKKLAKQYRHKISDDVSCILCSDDRHEVLNELDKDKAYEDILWWISQRSL